MPGTTPTKRRRPARLLALPVLLLPFVEIFVLIQVGQLVGVGWTIVLLVLGSLLGGWIVKREGARAYRALKVAVDSGRPPSKELADGALVLVGGLLVLIPGFVTDALGLVLLLPLTRPLFRSLLAVVVARQVLKAGAFPARPGNGRRPGPGPGGPVVRGEVVDDD